jgi:hypothetical protein
MIVAIHSRGGLMTDEKAMKRAEELGMVMPEDTEGTESTTEFATEDTSESGTQAAEPVVTKQPETQAAESVDTKELKTQKESESEKDNKTKNKDSESSESQESEADSSDIIKINIKRGDFCRQIAEKLHDKGLVEDAEDFRLYMQNNDYDNNLQAGTYEFKKGMTYKEIAEVLMKKS